MKYILDGHKAVPCHGLMEWARWMEKADRRVARDELGEVIVSTIFLGVDYRFGDGPPELFETLVFKWSGRDGWRRLLAGPNDEDTQRYATWEEAEAGHKEMVARELRCS